MTAIVPSQDLSPPQIVAVRTIIDTGSTVDAAAAAGVTARTVRRWRSSDAFQHAYRDAARRCSSEASSALLAAQSEAVDTLRRGLRAGSPATRTRAARAILEIGQRLADTDLDSRLDQLEIEVTAWHAETQHRPHVWSV